MEKYIGRELNFTPPPGIRGFESLLFTTASRTALGSTQPPIQRVSGVSGRGVKLTTHLYLVSRSRTRGAIPPLLNMP